MSGIELYRSTLTQLAAGDVVQPIESLKREMAALLGRIEGVESWPTGEEVLNPLNDRPERILAVAFPLVEYGEDRGAEAVVAEVRTLTRELTAREREGSAVGLALLLHHLVWALAAYCLANDRFPPLARIARIAIVRDDGAGVGIFANSDLRHATAFERRADRTYAHCLEWMRALSVRAEVARFTREQDLETALAEADLVAAMIGAREEREEVYSAIIGGDGAAERRLVEAVSDPAQAQDLARVFQLPADDLTRGLEEAYASLVTDRDRWPRRTRLFPSEG